MLRCLTSYPLSPYTTLFRSERDRPLSCEIAQLLDLLAMLAYLFHVAAAEFLPALRIVPEPFSQFGAGCELFHPSIYRGVSLLHATRPQPVNQYPGAVVGAGLT